jgi:hypothetical protein
VGGVCIPSLFPQPSPISLFARPVIWRNEGVQLPPTHARARAGSARARRKGVSGHASHLQR